MDSLDRDTVALLSRRAFDVAASTRGVQVFLNGKKLPVKNFKDYVDLCLKVRRNFISKYLEANRIYIYLSFHRDEKMKMEARSKPSTKPSTTAGRLPSLHPTRVSSRCHLSILSPRRKAVVTSSTSPT